MVFNKDLDKSLYQILSCNYKRKEILEFINLLPEELLEDIRKRLIKAHEFIDNDYMTYDDFEYVNNDGLVYKISIDCGYGEEFDLTIDLKYTDTEDKNIQYMNFIKSLMLTKGYEEYDPEVPNWDIGNYEEIIQIFGKKLVEGYEPFFDLDLKRAGVQKRDETEYNTVLNQNGFGVQYINCNTGEYTIVYVDDKVPEEISISTLNFTFGEKNPKKLVKKPKKDKKDNK